MEIPRCSYNAFRKVGMSEATLTGQQQGGVTKHLFDEVELFGTPFSIGKVSFPGSGKNSL